MIVTVYITNRRIESDDSEQHKPYLVLDNIASNNKLDPYKYYLTFIGRNYHQKYSDLSDEEIIRRENNYMSITIMIKNIGYGVATNIKFYDLLTGNDIVGTQSESMEENQKLFTTLDAAAGEEKKIQVKLLTETLPSNMEHNRILCVYKDLNEHIYTFIFSINVKDNEHYDFFAYQPSSHSYKRWYRECKKQHKEILDRYAEL